jgi:hypothetical protein
MTDAGAATVGWRAGPRRTMVVLGIAVVVLVGCGSPGSGKTAPPVNPPAAAAPRTVVLEDFVGGNLKDVRAALEELGLDDEAVSDNGKSVLDASNWTVTAQEPAAGTEVETDSVVRLTVSDQDDPPTR